MADRIKPLSWEDDQRVKEMPDLIREIFLYTRLYVNISVDDFEKKAADILNKAFAK
jgi:hypothetical protein